MSAPPRVWVFLGPTLDHAEALGILDAEYRPPVRSTDLPLARAVGVDVAVIIDGAFVQATTAGVSQIALCLAGGMRVFGAASAGALRAVECAPLGMVGIGEIYQRFAAGFEDEDELAVVFDPDSGRALSVAMINVRYACEQAVAEGVLAPGAADALIERAKAIHFSDRHWAGVLAAADGVVAADQLAAFDRFRRHRGGELDLKARDARACLEAVARFVAETRDVTAPATGRPEEVDRPGRRAPDAHAVAAGSAMGELVRTGDSGLAHALVAEAHRRPDDRPWCQFLDIAFGEAALRVALDADARRAWAALKQLNGDPAAADELIATLAEPSPGSTESVGVRLAR